MCKTENLIGQAVVHPRESREEQQWHSFFPLNTVVANSAAAATLLTLVGGAVHHEAVSALSAVDWCSCGDKATMGLFDQHELMAAGKH